MAQSLLSATVKSGLRGLLLQELCSGSGQNGGLLRVLWLGEDEKQILRLRRRMTLKGKAKADSLPPTAKPDKFI
jgi:hypothetical protein